MTFQMQSWSSSRAECRRKQRTSTWDKVTCPECQAASRADG